MWGTISLGYIQREPVPETNWDFQKAKEVLLMHGIWRCAPSLAPGSAPFLLTLYWTPLHAFVAFISLVQHCLNNHGIWKQTRTTGIWGTGQSSIRRNLNPRWSNDYRYYIHTWCKDIAISCRLLYTEALLVSTWTVANSEQEKGQKHMGQNNNRHH